LVGFFATHYDLKEACAGLTTIEGGTIFPATPLPDRHIQTHAPSMKSHLGLHRRGKKERKKKTIPGKWFSPRNSGSRYHLGLKKKKKKKSKADPPTRN
jgi:hypothetical protein